MISSVNLMLGSDTGSGPLSFDAPPSVTIFVGPNNSGKSQCLREIFQTLSGKSGPPNVVVDHLGFTGFSAEDAGLEFSRRTAGIGQNPPGSSHSTVNLRVGDRFEQINAEKYISALMSPNEVQNRYIFGKFHLAESTIFLDGASRMSLLDPQSRGDLRNPVSNFAKLFVDSAKKETLRRLIHAATNLHFAMDISEGSIIKVRFGSTPPPNERSFEDETLRYMHQSREVKDVGDGVRAFAGILVQLHFGTPKVIVIDEPEAFLHPALAFTLGKELARGAIEEQKHVFASTHSSRFLMGAISSGAFVNIVRLTFDGRIVTARLLDNASLKMMMRNPLLRSVGVLDGLFYDSVIVGEANADRAFYQEINERLLSANDPRGTQRTLFLNADTKQTIPAIIHPLRQLGIPTAGIVDIDLFKDGGREWARHLDAIGVPSAENAAYATRRQTLLNALNASGTDFKRNGGIELLNGGERELAENLINDLRRYGLFVVPHGELEGWLSSLAIERSKDKWLKNIFEKMGEDPSDADYVTPQENDVWDFIGSVGLWFRDKLRKGIPAG